MEESATRTPPRAAVLGLALVLVTVLAAVRLFSDGEPQASSTGPATRPSTTASPAGEVVSPYESPRPALPDEAVDGIRFVEVAARAGLGDGAGEGDAGPTAAQVDAGAAVVDLDDDGDLDLLLTSSGGASGLHLNEGGSFTDITADAGLTGLDSATAPAFADIDADGDLDLFLGGPGNRFGRLLVNDGAGRFTDESTARGVVGRPDDEAVGRSIRGVDFGDVDRDGDLDLVVTDWNPGAVIAADVARGEASDRNSGQCNRAATTRRDLAAGLVQLTGDTRLFRNDGGRFTDVTRPWGLADLGISLAFTPQLVDLDGDGWLDLAVTGDACTSRLFRNRRGDRFVDVTRRAGVGTDENGMGSVIRDLDGDGRPDWLVTSIAYPTRDGTCPAAGHFAGCTGNRVYLNRGRLQFEDGTDELGLRNSGWGWGAAAADFGNDGRLQVAVTNGRLGGETVDPSDQTEVYYAAFTGDPTRFFVRGPDEVFTDAADRVGIRDEEVSHALVVFDHDRDGRLDLLVANAGAAPYLYRNVSAPRGHWIGVRLRDPATPGNAQGLGARVEVTSSTGAVTTQWVHTSGSYESQHPAETHVGLGSATAARVRVWWPGEERPQVVSDPATDRLVTVTRRR
ncbi:CRTAC1 family protein [Nocardioides terrigena]|uniref:CRTAC1 family protein n=1 Tax=Nocardioides terrigena TaxID=424797 RepID=UPI00131F469A|nr:CRTAC1 family protein [Nocardioides terrigena]